MQLNTGLFRLSDKIEVSTTNQVIIIWVITAIATFSVITGLKLGIRRLSETCFCIGMFIMIVIMLYDETWYLLNIYVQSIGKHMFHYNLS